MHTGGEEGVDEGTCITDDAIPRAGVLLGEVGVVGGDLKRRGDLLFVKDSIAKQSLDGRNKFELQEVVLLEGRALLAESSGGILIHDHTDGDGSIMKRDVPDPSLLVSHCLEEGSILLGGSGGVLVASPPVSPYGVVLETGVHDTIFMVLGGHDSSPSTSINQVIEGRLALFFDIADLSGPGDGDGPFGLSLGEGDAGDTSVLVDVGAEGLSLLHDHIVKFGSDDIPAEFGGVGFDKVGVAFFLVLVQLDGGTILDLETVIPDFLVGADELEEVADVWQETFANVVPGELNSLKERDFDSFLTEQSCGV